MPQLTWEEAVADLDRYCPDKSLWTYWAEYDSRYYYYHPEDTENQHGGWTTEVPTENGYYAYRFSPGTKGEVQLVLIVNGVAMVDAYDHYTEAVRTDLSQARSAATLGAEWSRRQIPQL